MRAPQDNPHTLTHAGESLKKAVMEGRVQLADVPNPRKRPRGQTRGQARLVACQGPADGFRRRRCGHLLPGAQVDPRDPGVSLLLIMCYILF